MIRISAELIQEERAECAAIARHWFDHYAAKHCESVMAGDGLHEAWSIGMAAASKIETAILERGEPPAEPGA